MDASRVTWAALFAMMAATPGCSSSGSGTENLPPDDPCYMRDGCDTVQVLPLSDGGVVEVPEGTDGGPEVQTRFCGACNG